MTSPGDAARALSAETARSGESDPTAWFERLYRAAGAGDAVVPWDHEGPEPMLVRWAGGRPGAGHRAIVVGCGLGDDAEFVAGLGYATVAFDVSPSAVELAHRRFPESTVDYQVANLLALPAPWRHAFDLVVEDFTVQSMPAAVRAPATAAVAGLVAPGGTLIVHASVRSGGAERRPGPPWPLDRAEVEAFATDGLVVVGVAAIPEPGHPTAQSWQAEFHRPG